MSHSISNIEIVMDYLLKRIDMLNGVNKELIGKHSTDMLEKDNCIQELKIENQKLNEKIQIITEENSRLQSQVSNFRHLSIAFDQLNHSLRKVGIMILFLQIFLI